MINMKRRILTNNSICRTPLKLTLLIQIKEVLEELLFDKTRSKLIIEIRIN